MLVIGLVFAAAVSGGWYVYNRPAATPQKQGPPQYTSRDDRRENPAGNGAQPKDEQPISSRPRPAKAQLTLAEERDPVLEVMQRDAKSRDRNLRPPYCQRVVAQTAADCGKLELAQKYVGPACPG